MEKDTPSALKDPRNISYYTVIPHFFGKENLTIRGTACRNADSSSISLLKGKKLIKEVKEKMVSLLDVIEPIRVADINGDGLLDIKLVIPYRGSGLASMNVRIIYLFQVPENKFTKLAYTDMTYGMTTEHDMNGDGNYEIISMDLKGYKTHNYWIFNIYNYKNNSLINVNDKYDYPIMVQYLFRQNYTPTEINKNVRKKFSLKYPEEYELK